MSWEPGSSIEAMVRILANREANRPHNRRICTAWRDQSGSCVPKAESIWPVGRVVGPGHRSRSVRLSGQRLAKSVAAERDAIGGGAIPGCTRRETSPELRIPALLGEGTPSPCPYRRCHACQVGSALAIDPDWPGRACACGRSARRGVPHRADGVGHGRRLRPGNGCSAGALGQRRVRQFGSGRGWRAQDRLPKSDAAAARIGQ
jgi:hypothetical protein